MTSVLEKMEGVTNISASRDLLALLKDIQVSVQEVLYYVEILEALKAPIGVARSRVVAVIPRLKTLASQSGSLSKAILTELVTEIKFERDRLNADVISHEESLSNLRHIAQRLSDEHSALQDALKGFTESLVSYANVKARTKSTTTRGLGEYLNELQTACRNVRASQERLARELRAQLGGSIRDEVLEDIGSCRPVAFNSLSADELIALRSTRLSEFLSLRLRTGNEN